MNVDAVVLALLALFDLAVLIRLRQRHNRRMRVARLGRFLSAAIRRELARGRA